MSRVPKDLNSKNRRSQSLIAIFRSTDLLSSLIDSSPTAALGATDQPLDSHLIATDQPLGGLPQKTGTNSKKTSQVNISRSNKFPTEFHTKVPAKFPPFTTAIILGFDRNSFLYNVSTNTTIASNPALVVGSWTIKSMETWSHGCLGIGSG